MTGGATAVVYEARATGERLEVEVPLACRRDIAELREEAGLPGYLDISEPNTARAVALLWAVRSLDSLGAEHDDLRSLRQDLRVAVFGGVAFRLLSPSANGDGVFARPIGDLDLISTKSDGAEVVTLLMSLDRVLGSRFWHAVTRSDKNFNSMRAGKRYRVRGVREDAGAQAGVRCDVIDIFAEELEFCHRVPVPSEGFPDEFGTIGPAELVATKLQYIRAARPDEVPDHQEHRVAGELGKNVLVGPEIKDLNDVCALLSDRGVGDDAGQIRPGRFGALLASDWGLAKTLRLNLSNRAAFDAALEAAGADSEAAARVASALDALETVANDDRHQAKKPRFQMSKTWWQYVEDD